MSRSGYSDDVNGWDLVRWRGAVNSAVRGKRGQAVLRELLAALEAMPEKRLARDSLVSADGEFCTLGALGHARGLDMSLIDPDDREQVAQAFGIAEAMAAEIMFLNDNFDEYNYVQFEIFGPMRPWQSRIRWMRVIKENAPECRWQYMRNWIEEQTQKAGAQ